MTEKEYLVLKNKIWYVASGHGFDNYDCEDILHDACVHIVEHITPPEDYTRILYKYLGKYRERRHREGKRDDKATKLEELEATNESNIK
jgi:hypothetical protein|tara:strand:+ start:183 stop:449 length:267 start_codon:yes stop_codon:yes gene_type:complete